MVLLAPLLMSKFVEGWTVAVRPFRVLRPLAAAALNIADHAAIGCEVDATRRALFHASMSAMSYPIRPPARM